jgi:hypothetical protein
MNAFYGNLIQKISSGCLGITDTAKKTFLLYERMISLTPDLCMKPVSARCFHKQDSSDPRGSEAQKSDEDYSGRIKPRVLQQQSLFFSFNIS